MVILSSVATSDGLNSFTPAEVTWRLQHQSVVETGISTFDWD